MKNHIINVQQTGYSFPFSHKKKGKMKGEKEGAKPVLNIILYTQKYSLNNQYKNVGYQK